MERKINISSFFRHQRHKSWRRWSWPLRLFYWALLFLFWLLVSLFFKNLANQIFFRFIGRQLFLFFQKQVEPVFKSVLCSSFKLKLNSWPSLVATAFQNYLEKLPILLSLPWSLLNFRVKVTTPMLSALLGSPENSLLVVSIVEFLGNALPIEWSQLSEFVYSILYDAQKKVFLIFLPFMMGQFKLLQANEFEHAIPACCSWNQLCDLDPIIFGLG